MSAVLGVFALATLLSFHPNSLSHSYLRIEGRTVDHRVRCQVLSILEVLPELDLDGDGRLSAEEIERGRGALGSYFAGHFHLDAGEGVPLAPEIIEAAPSPPRDDPLDPFREMDWVELDLRWTAGEPIERLGMRVTVFRDTSPGHLEFCTVEGPDGRTAEFLLDPEVDREEWGPSRRGSAIGFFGVGWHHILSGWDHLAFLAALLLATRGLAALLWVVTAFTIAHSITLALAVLDAIEVAAVVPFVEPAIALSIAFVAADNLLHLDRPRTRAIESFIFGLVHGLGFAGFLEAALHESSSRGSALVLFNLGVEAGQIVIVAVTVVLIRCVTPSRSFDPSSSLSPRFVRRYGSVVLVLLGLILFLLRGGPS